MPKQNTMQSFINWDHIQYNLKKHPFKLDLEGSTINTEPSSCFGAIWKYPGAKLGSPKMIAKYQCFYQASWRVSCTCGVVMRGHVRGVNMYPINLFFKMYFFYCGFSHQQLRAPSKQATFEVPKSQAHDARFVRVGPFWRAWGGGTGIGWRGT